MTFPKATALENTCVLETPSELVNQAFRYAKDNIARCMRWYTLGWGMSNAPHQYAVVVGRDTGWMSLGVDYVAPWFAPAALKVFRDRQKPNGQILEYVDMESGAVDDYGLNVADNTPLYIWGAWHHWQMHADETFRADFLDSVRAAADHLEREIGPDNLLVSVPAGTALQGITSWRNIIPRYVLAGEVTEINALSAMALRQAAAFTGDPRYAAAADRIGAAINTRLWNGDTYLLNIYEGRPNPQVSGDEVFPLFTGVSTREHTGAVLERLEQPDFWSARGLRTLPTSDPAYEPEWGSGLLGGSWPNLTLWYAAAAACYIPDRALEAIEMVARPVVESQPPAQNVHPTEFAEYFHGESGANLGMHLSPWVAPTFIWAVMEGLLGLEWEQGKPKFRPNWPTGWNHVAIRNLPCGAGVQDVELTR